MEIVAVFIMWAFITFILCGGSNDRIRHNKTVKKVRGVWKKMNTLKPVKIPGDIIQPNKVLGASVNVYLKNGNEPFRFKITGCSTLKNKKYLDGHDDEMLNLSIAVNDIEFITIR